VNQDKHKVKGKSNEYVEKNIVNIVHLVPKGINEIKTQGNNPPIII
jgi:hypothetical protein